MQYIRNPRDPFNKSSNIQDVSPVFEIEEPDFYQLLDSTLCDIPRYCLYVRYRHVLSTTSTDWTESQSVVIEQRSAKLTSFQMGKIDFLYSWHSRTSWLSFNP